MKHSASVVVAALVVVVTGCPRDPAAASLAERDARYNAQALRVMQRALPPDGTAVDVGSFEGDVLAQMLAAAPRGHHHGVDPLPALAARLRARFAGSPVTVHEVAAGERDGTARFTHVVTNPGYSGFKARSYDRPEERTEEIEVRVARLDALIPSDQRVHFVKIDVEGAELQVLRGATRLLARWRPVVVFEHGLGAADHYGTRPEAVYDLLRSAGLQVGRMGDYLDGRPGLSRADFARAFDTRADWYFAAWPAR